MSRLEEEWSSSEQDVASTVNIFSELINYIQESVALDDRTKAIEDLVGVMKNIANREDDILTGFSLEGASRYLQHVQSKLCELLKEHQLQDLKEIPESSVEAVGKILPEHDSINVHYGYCAPFIFLEDTLSFRLEDDFQSVQADQPDEAPGYCPLLFSGEFRSDLLLIKALEKETKEVIKVDYGDLDLGSSGEDGMNSFSP
jgi:hypothetical protein